MVPTLDIPAAKTLGDALRHVSYSEESIEELLGEDAWTTALEDVPVHERRLPQSPLATAIRLFFLELPVKRAAAEHALGSAGVGALERTGLAQIGKHVSPQARIAPVESLLLASDRLSTNPTDDPPDYVSTYSPTARLCDLLTPRPQVERALDVGTGNGVQALLVAGHSEHVVATDVNPRALGFTELNAALSGLDNVECRRGSLFEPVEGEQFGLITCNAPFVVSPERRWTYRDGSHDGDELSARIVRESVEHLAPDGYATLMVSWLGRRADEPDDPGERVYATFSMVVTQIVVVDLVFSIDSIVTAIGMAQDIEIMIAAVVIAMAVMYVSSGPVARFIAMHPTTKMLALAFLVMIGLALVADGFAFHIPRGYIYSSMAFAGIVEVFNVLARRNRARNAARTKRQGMRERHQ